METVSECELNCIELRILELEKILTTLTSPDNSNMYFPNNTINLNYYVFGKNYTIYYTIDKITEPDDEGTYNPSGNTSITGEFTNNSNKYTIPAEFKDYGVYEVYETGTNKLLNRFVIITGAKGAGYYNIYGNIIEGGEITEDIYTLSYDDKPEGEVAWVIVPNTVKEFKVEDDMGVFDGSEGGFSKLIACYFEKHVTREVSGDFWYMFYMDYNLVAVNYNDLISSMKDTAELHMYQMFIWCHGITSVSFEKGVFNELTVGLLDMFQMFYDCIGITSVSFEKGVFSGFKVEEDTLTMYNMFYACSTIETIELNDVFSVTPKLYIDLFGGTTTKINTITIKEEEIPDNLYPTVDQDVENTTHKYNLFNFRSTNNKITLKSTDAVVNMLLSLNPIEGARQISLTCTDNNITFSEKDNITRHTFTLEYIGNVWNIINKY